MRRTDKVSEEWCTVHSSGVPTRGSGASVAMTGTVGVSGVGEKPVSDCR